MELAIGIILIVAALFLIIAVLMQHGKDHNLSGTIAGASESFFGKSKSTTLDKKLSVLTSVVAVVFVILVLVMYLGQGHKGETKQGPGTGEETNVESVDTQDEGVVTDDASEEGSAQEGDAADPEDGGDSSAPEDGGDSSAPEDGSENPETTGDAN